jgi:hypothetical protein
MGLALLVAVPGAQAASFRPEKSTDGDVNAIMVDSTNKVFLIASDPRNEF